MYVYIYNIYIYNIYIYDIIYIDKITLSHLKYVSYKVGVVKTL